MGFYMNKKVLLPFEIDPLSVMYHYIAFPLGVIQGNAKCDITPWLCHMFVNCIFNPFANNKFSISFSDNWGIDDKIVFHQQMCLFNDTYNIIGIDIIQLIKKMLANRCYVGGNYNEEYVPGKKAYGLEYFPHDFLLNGFDNEKKVFYSVSYLSKKFVNHEIPYSNMLQALTSMANKRPILNFYQYNTETKINLNIEKTLRALQDYLSSSNSLHQYTKGFFYGLEAIDKLGEYYVSYTKQKNFDHRYTKGLMEQKNIMHKRIKYLCSKKYITDKEYISKSKTVSEYSTIIHNLGIRYKLLGDCKILQEIKVIIQKMKEIELSYLVSVENELELLTK